MLDLRARRDRRQHSGCGRLAVSSSADRAGVAVVAGILAVTVALHLEWLLRFRRGYLTEWDESGYMQYALSNFDALHDHGVVEFAKVVGGRGTFGPLLPLVTALAYPVVGRGIFGSLLVVPVFFLALLLATYGLARGLVPRWWAILATLTVAAIPAVTDYTRVFHFAVPTAACMTAALWALVRSKRLLRAPWAVAFGGFVALMLLARTMTVAFIPGLALAAAVQLIGVDNLRPRLKNLAFACVAAVVVAGPWYLHNAGSVYDYLSHTGYGAQAAAYGRDYSIASWGFWSRELRTNVDDLSLPLAAVIGLCFVVAFVAVLIRSRPRPALRPRSDAAAGLIALAAVVLEGYLVLTSSRNEGTAFALPWFPALVVLAVAAAATVRPHALRLALAASLVLVAIGALLAKSGFVKPLADPRSASIPGLGSVVVTDGRGIIQGVVAGAGYDIGSPTEPMPRMHREWLPVERRVVGWSIAYADAHQRPLNLTLGFDDLLFADTRLHLAAQLWFHRSLPVDYLRSAAGGDTTAAYRSQLVAPRPENVLITGEERPNATITERKVEAAARSLGFVRLKQFTLPDGRKIWAWWREGA
jgi:hypothetical protein